MSLNSAVGYPDPSRDVRVVRCSMGHEYAVSAEAFYSCPLCTSYSMAPGQMIPVQAGYTVNHTGTPEWPMAASVSHAAQLRAKMILARDRLTPDTPGDWLDNEINKVRQLAFAA